MSRRIESEPAFLLHRRPFRNTSLILSYVTQHYGRVTLVGRGVRSPQSRYRVAAQQFVPLHISWSGRNELKSLVSADSAGGFVSIEGEPLLCGMYMNELLERLLPLYDAHPQIFSVYQDTLSLLSSGGLPEIVLRYFERTLLMDLGYGVMWDRDAVTGEQIEAETDYRYYPDVGLVACEAHDTERTGLICSGRALQRFTQRLLSDPEDIRQVKVLMRTLIAERLDHKKLRSKDLFVRSTESGVVGEAEAVRCHVS